jgi:hypothetical protein
MILAVLFAVTTINYADRATIAIAGPELKKLLGLSPVQMGFVFSAFAWSYVLAQLPGGWLLDRFGSKIVYFFSIFLWSLFTMLMGGVGFFTGATVALFTLRLLIGAAEAPSFPGNSRIASSWFPTASAARRRHLQLGPVFCDRAVRAHHGLAGALVRLGERVLRDGRAGHRHGLHLAEDRLRPERPPARQRGRTGLHRRARWSTWKARTRRPPPPSSIPGPASSSCWATACCWACTSASTASTR